MKPQTPKGFRDSLPDQARLRESIITTLKEVFSLYGFSPLETPAIEYQETLLGKYGKEADKLIFLFEDRGARQVGLRYDMTVPLARVVAQYQNELPIPFKRYQIAPAWRAEKPQAGRYREFWQADIDLVGSSSLLADVEILSCALTSLTRLGFTDYQILVNDRKYLDSLGVTPEAAIIIDKLEKIGEDEVKKELENKVGKDNANSIIKSLKEAQEPNSIKQIKRLLDATGLPTERVVFDPWLARGLEYYTGPIFEIKIKGYKGSIGGGGRYDNLIGQFAGRSLPAVGISFGIERVTEALDQTQILAEEKGVSAPKVLVTVFNPDLKEKSLEVAFDLREAGVTAEVYPDEEAKLDKQLKYADKRGVPKSIIIGPEEAQENKATLKDMNTGEQETLTLDQLVKKLA